MSELADALTNPILNGPYDPPERHFVLGADGPTGEIRSGRRASESFVPIPQERKGKRAVAESQQAFDFDLTGERREANDTINGLRRDVELWRARHYNGVTPITRKLLEHWADPTRENRVLFCQREAAETAIFLTEVAGRQGYTDWRRGIDAANDEHNAGLPRIALKMATGSGKTVVMAMLIAWQTLNKLQTPRDVRFTNKFLIVAPGITIRDRLRVLQPNEPGNYFDERDLAVYTSKAYGTLCEQFRVTQSMGAIGTSADNSLAESFNAALKRELLEGRAAFPDQATAYRAVFRWAHRYNTRRRHSAIGNITPNTYEAAYAATASATLAEAA